VNASAGVIVLTCAGVIAMVYAFVCSIRADRVARVAVNRIRASEPALWRRLDWLTRLANPAIKMRVLRSSHGVRDPQFDGNFKILQRLERQQWIAVGVGFACAIVAAVGTKLWGWRWG
jgi:hypothetical protein